MRWTETREPIAFGRGVRRSRADRFAVWCADERNTLFLCLVTLAICLIVVLGGF